MHRPSRYGFGIAVWLAASRVAAGDPVVVPPHVGTGLRLTDVTAGPGRPTLSPELQDSGSTYWGMFKLCVSAEGQVTGIEVLHGTGEDALDARWMQTLRGWKFRPYEVAGQKVPFCYLTRVEVGAWVPASGTVMLAPAAGAALRTTDITRPPHRPAVPPELMDLRSSWWGMFKACVSVEGAVNHVEIVKSTGDPGLDSRWLKTIQGWRYRPYVVNGRVVPFCHPLRVEVKQG
jgi:TonB family protein